jgi:hypothetical protein
MSRYALAAVVLAVFAAGCAGTGFRPTAQHGRGYGPPPQPPAYGRSLQERRFGGGITLGSVLGVSSDAVDGFDDTEFGSGTLTGAHLTFLFPSRYQDARSPFDMKFGVELRFEDYAMLLSEHGFDFGELHMSNVTAAFAMYQMPRDYDFFGFHFDLGLGAGSSSFKKDSMLIADEIAYGYYTDVSTGGAGIFSLGGGADFYLSPFACISLDLRYAMIVIPVDWKEDGISRPDVDWFDASNTQIMIGLRVFF